MHDEKKIPKKKTVFMSLIKYKEIVSISVYTTMFAMYLNSIRKIASFFFSVRQGFLWYRVYIYVVALVLFFPFLPFDSFMLDKMLGNEMLDPLNEKDDTIFSLCSSSSSALSAFRCCFHFSDRYIIFRGEKNRVWWIRAK